MVGGDAVAMAGRIMASPLAYRIGVVGDLASQILFVFRPKEQSVHLICYKIPEG